MCTPFSVRLRRTGGIAVVVFGLVGCGGGGSSAVTVTGKVVYKPNGEPATLLGGGYVCLQSVSDPENKPTGRIDDVGTFFLGTRVGEKNLGGVLPGTTASESCRLRTKRAARGGGRIEPRFMSFDKSGIRVSIVRGRNDLPIEVERPKR